MNHIRKIAIIVVPPIIVALLFFFYGQPREATTVVVNASVPAGAEILHTTGFNCQNKISLEEFNQAHSAEKVLVTFSSTYQFRLSAVVNDSTSSCTTADLVSVKPTVYGQFIESYEIDEDGGTVTLEIGSEWVNTDGIDSVGFLTPAILALLVGAITAIYVIATLSAQYTNIWEQSY